jgi:hypothetical protein
MMKRLLKAARHYRGLGSRRCPGAVRYRSEHIVASALDLRPREVLLQVATTFIGRSFPASAVSADEALDFCDALVSAYLNVDSTPAAAPERIRTSDLRFRSGPFAGLFQPLRRSWGRFDGFATDCVCRVRNAFGTRLLGAFKAAAHSLALIAPVALLALSRHELADLREREVRNAGLGHGGTVYRRPPTPAAAQPRPAKGPGSGRSGRVTARSRR